jgi:diacylglycerol kinase (ATP)
MPKDVQDPKPTVKPPRAGLWHVVDAGRYSLAGFRRLMQETAARQELVGGLVGMGVLIWAQASAAQWLGFVVLFATLLAIEALNTAIEELADHISPGWSETAKHAKDLGSLAVGLMILANLALIAMVIVGKVFG